MKSAEYILYLHDGVCWGEGVVDDGHGGSWGVKEPYYLYIITYNKPSFV